MRQRRHSNVDRIIAELGFGFWTSLFDIRYKHNQIMSPHMLHLTHDTTPDLLRSGLKNILNLRHELCQLANLIDWERLDQEVGKLISIKHRLSCHLNPFNHKIIYLNHI